jgi:hypothetical protein
MVGRQLGDGCRVASSRITKEILRLMAELIEIGPNGKMAVGHDEPPWRMPGVRSRRAKGGSQ